MARTTHAEVTNPKKGRCCYCKSTLKEGATIYAAFNGKVIKHKFCSRECNQAKTLDNMQAGIYPGMWEHRLDSY